MSKMYKITDFLTKYAKLCLKNAQYAFLFVENSKKICEYNICVSFYMARKAFHLPFPSHPLRLVILDVIHATFGNLKY